MSITFDELKKEHIATSTRLAAVTAILQQVLLKHRYPVFRVEKTVMATHINDLGLDILDNGDGVEVRVTRFGEDRQEFDIFPSQPLGAQMEYGTPVADDDFDTDSEFEKACDEKSKELDEAEKVKEAEANAELDSLLDDLFKGDEALSFT